MKIEKKVEKNPFYKISEWNGLPLYQCTKDSFSTLNKDVMEEHIKQYMPAPKTFSAPIETDRFGNKVK